MYNNKNLNIYFILEITMVWDKNNKFYGIAAKCAIEDGNQTQWWGKWFILNKKNK